MSLDTENTVETTISETTENSEKPALNITDEDFGICHLKITVCFKADLLDCVGFINKSFVKNGGFESGDFTDWENFSGEIVSDKKHSGSYGCRLYEAFIYQNLPNVPCACLGEFGFWAMGSPYNDCTLTFSDSSTAFIGIDQLRDIINGSTMSYVDLMPYCPNGKKLSRITFHGGSGAEWFIDDVALLTQVI